MLEVGKIRKMLPYLVVIIFAFYVLPLLIQDTGSAISILLIGNPIICLIVSFLYGMKNFFNWIFTLIVMLLFIPTIFIFFNESALIYTFIYGLFSLVGNFMGSLLRKKIQ